MMPNAEAALYSAKSMAEILAFIGPTGAKEIDVQNATWGVAHLIELALQDLESEARIDARRAARTDIESKPATTKRGAK